MRIPTLKEAYFRESRYITEADLEEILVDPAKHGKDVKIDAIETAIEDIKPYVEEDDPTLQTLNDLLTKATWENGSPKAENIGELPEGRQFIENNGEETASSIYGDEEDREILLDQEPPALSLCQGATMTPLANPKMDVIVVKVKDDGIVEKDSEEAVTGFSRIGAPGSPKFDQSTTEILTGEEESELEEADVVASTGGPSRQVGGPVLA